MNFFANLLNRCFLDTRNTQKQIRFKEEENPRTQTPSTQSSAGKTSTAKKHNPPNIQQELIEFLKKTGWTLPYSNTFHLHTFTDTIVHLDIPLVEKKQLLEQLSTFIGTRPYVIDSFFSLKDKLDQKIIEYTLKECFDTHGVDSVLFDLNSVSACLKSIQNAPLPVDKKISAYKTLETHTQSNKLSPVDSFKRSSLVQAIREALRLCQPSPKKVVTQIVQSQKTLNSDIKNTLKYTKTFHDFVQEMNTSPFIKAFKQGSLLASDGSLFTDNKLSKKINWAPLFGNKKGGSTDWTSHALL